MSQTTQDVDFSSGNSTQHGLKYVVLKVWSLIKPYLAGLSVVLGVLSALYISGVSSGSTSRTLDSIVLTQREDRHVAAELSERLTRIETEQNQIGVLTSGVLRQADELGQLKGVVKSVDDNVHLLLDALLRGKVSNLPAQPSVP